jgi:hypothetical protein
MRVFESSVLRRISGSKKKEIVAGWRKLHHEEINDLYSSPMNLRGVTNLEVT